MKKNITFLYIAWIGIALSSAAQASKCKSDYMSDSCSEGGYSIVETEHFVRSRHNHMESAHPYKQKSKKRIKYNYKLNYRLNGAGK